MSVSQFCKWLVILATFRGACIIFQCIGENRENSKLLNDINIKLLLGHTLKCKQPSFRGVVVEIEPKNGFKLRCL